MNYFIFCFTNLDLRQKIPLPFPSISPFTVYKLSMSKYPVEMCQFITITMNSEVSFPICESSTVNTQYEAMCGNYISKSVSNTSIIGRPMYNGHHVLHRCVGGGEGMLIGALTFESRDFNMLHIFRIRIYDLNTVVYDSTPIFALIKFEFS